MIHKGIGCSTTINKRPKKSLMDCDRIICTDSNVFPLTSNLNHKFFEKITFNNNQNRNNYVICIGVNPRTTSNVKFDRSNQKISKFLISQGFDGYYLINMFSIITDNTQQLDYYNQNNTNDIYNNFQGVIEFFIKDNNYPILLFYGAENRKYLNSSLRNLLISLSGSRVFIGSVKSNNVFTHAGSQSCGSRMTGSFIYLNGSNIINFL